MLKGVILAGGTGSRLWPLSRESYPKQFLNLLDDKLSLLQTTYNRIKDLENLSKPIVICNEEHRFIVGDQMRKIKTEPLEIILEPVRKNTTPAITVAALKAIEYFKNSNKDPILLILSSDHQIQDIEKFKRSIRYSLHNAKKGKTLIWPSDFTHTHRGQKSPTQEKYIATGWFNHVDVAFIRGEISKAVAQKNA